MMVYLYGLIVVGALLGGGYWYVTGVIDENAELREEVSQLVRDKHVLEKENLRLELEDEAEDLRQQIAFDKQMESQIAAVKKSERVDKERLTKVSMEKSKLVEKLAHKAIKNNVEVLECKSDLRNTDEENPCPDDVR